MSDPFDTPPEDSGPFELELDESYPLDIPSQEPNPFSHPAQGTPTAQATGDATGGIIPYRFFRDFSG